MVDNTESATWDGEQQDTPSSDASQTTVGQQTSPSQDLDAIVNSLREHQGFQEFVDDRADRRAQSQKDRRIDRLEKRQDGFAERLERYEELRESGMEPAQARSQLQFEDDRAWLRAERERQENARSSTQSTTGTRQGLSDNVKAVLSQFNVPADNPEVVKVLQGKSETDAITEAIRIGQKLQEVGSAVGASQIAAPKGGTLPVTNMDKEYLTKIRAAQGNRAEIRRLKAEYRQKGVNVDGVIIRVE